MRIRDVRVCLLASVAAFGLSGLIGCGGDETGTQVEVDQKKADALLNSMGGYGGYAKKSSKAKQKADAKAVESPAPEPAAAP